MSATIKQIIAEHQEATSAAMNNEDFAAHLIEQLTATGYGSLHDAYEKGFAAGFDKAADDIGAWSNITDYGEDSSGNPYPITDNQGATRE